MALEHLQAAKLFGERIGELFGDDLLKLGIVPDNLTGSFGRRSLDVVRAACLKYPQLHIITRRPPMTINRYVEGAFLFGLANGDADPTLEFTLRDTTVAEYGLILEQFERAMEGRSMDNIDRFSHLLLKAWSAGADPQDPKTVGELLNKDQNNLGLCRNTRFRWQ